MPDPVPRTAARTGLRAAAVWVAVEFGIRTIGILLFFVAFTEWRGTEPSPGQIGVASSVLLFDSLLLWIVFDRWRRRAGWSLNDLGYRFTWAAGVMGVVCGLAIFGPLWVSTQVDSRVFGLAESSERLRGFAEAGLPAILPFLVGNAILAPLVEEFAWRGIVQRLLSAAWGRAIGLIVTAGLFAFKHVIVDLSLERATTLVVVSLCLGVIRDRLGAFASTLAHATLNFIASVVAIVTALTR